MNTRQTHDDHSNEQVCPKRRKSLYEKAAPTTLHNNNHASSSSSGTFNTADVAILNNLGVDCFEHGGIPDASQCFQNAMSIFAPALPQSLSVFKSLPPTRYPPAPVASRMTRQVSNDPADNNADIVVVVDSDSQAADGNSYNQVRAVVVSGPLTPSPSEAPASATVAAPTPRTEYDEGMNSYTRPLRIDNNDYDYSAPSPHYDYHRTVPVLLFNIGQLHVLGGDDTTAANYFMYALDIINQRNNNDFNNTSYCPAQFPQQHLQHQSVDAMPILHNLGHIYYRAQNYKLALSMYSKALEIAQKHQSGMNGNNKNNLSAMASTLNCLGVVFFHMTSNSDENASKALNLFTTSLEIRKSLLSNNVHGMTSAATTVNVEDAESQKEIATTMNNVGRVYYMLGDHTAALATYIEAYRLRKELMPAYHLDLAASAYNLGQTHHQLGNLDDAMTLYMEFYEIVSNYLGPTHRDVAIILKFMAQIHHDKSQYDEAGRLYYKSLQTTKAALGELHPEVASTLNKIGNMYYENSDFDAAIKAYEEGLGVERAVLQSDHQNIVVTLTNIAQSHKHKGNHAAALERYTEAYNLQRAVLGATNPKVAITLSNVAQVSCRLGRFTRALDAYQEVLQIRRDTYGDEHVEVAATLNSIGLVLFRQGYHALAIESFEESLRVRRLCLGDQHRDVAVVLYNIATTHLEQGDEDKAMACYAETLRMERCTLGNDHRDLVVTLQHIGQVFRQRGELDTSLEYFTEVLRIERLHHGNDSPMVARLLNKMGNIYLQKADVPNMMECLAEATRIFERLGSSTEADAGSDANGEEMNEELKITGYNFYSLSIFHPECAAAA
mmetsp:Transcript_4094/g.9192  ORF Transcript_4094/g.9192 Transcript_4094/m.9192 type:complete len:837 (-) Transcript_4094:109-2619(-)